MECEEVSEKSRPNNEILAEFVEDSMRDEPDVVNFRRWYKYEGPLFLIGASFCLTGIIALTAEGVHAPSIGVTIIGLISLYSSYSFGKNREDSNFNIVDTYHHDVAYAIHQYQNGDFQKLREKLNNLSNNMQHFETLSDRRERELKEYINHAIEKDDDYVEETFEPVFSQIVIEISNEVNNPLFEPEEENEEDVPSAIESIISGIDLHHLNDPIIAGLLFGILSFSALYMVSQGHYELAAIIATLTVGLFGVLRGYFD